ncbi:MAG: orotidine-5'-phosphate decarboxylase [Patescibacteria group bacterium]
MNAKDRIIVGLDVDTLYRAEFFVRLLKDEVGGFKIGNELALVMLKSVIKPLTDEMAIANTLSVRRIFANLKSGPYHQKVFWDVKFHDISNTIGASSLQVADLDAGMFSIHASAGKEAIEAAVRNKKASKVFGVTVLTSINDEKCVSIFGDLANEKVLQFAEILLDAGADGIICSPLEVAMLRGYSKFNRLKIATPGIRPLWYEKNDQERVMTPSEAILAGADLLIVSRPILNSPKEIGNPADAARKIVEEVDAALNLIKNKESPA